MLPAVFCALVLVLEGAAGFQPAPCGSLGALQLRRRPASCFPLRAAPLAGAPARLLTTGRARGCTCAHAHFSRLHPTARARVRH